MCQSCYSTAICLDLEKVRMGINQNIIIHLGNQYAMERAAIEVVKMPTL